jgi:hypothetical protein
MRLPTRDPPLPGAGYAASDLTPDGEPPCETAFAYLSEALNVCTHRFLAKEWARGRSVSDPWGGAQAHAGKRLLRALRDGALTAEGVLERADPNFRPRWKGDTQLPIDPPVLDRVPRVMWKVGEIDWRANFVSRRSAVDFELWRHVQIPWIDINRLWPPSDADENPPEQHFPPAPDLEIHKFIAAAYKEAASAREKPPNIKQVATYVQKKLAASGYKTSARNIQLLAQGEQHDGRRLLPGVTWACEIRRQQR